MIGRVTQNMIMGSSFASMQAAAGRVAKVQEQLATGRVINRPSDNPADASSAMRLRAEQAKQAQYERNANDGLGWLDQTDATLQSMLSQVQRARDLATQGANAGTMSPTARQGVVAELNQIRASLITQANATYLGRPIFGGLTDAASAYTTAGAQIRTDADGAVTRTIADGVTLQINTNGPEVFGPDGANVFDELTNLTNAVAAGDNTAVTAGIGKMKGFVDKFSSALSEVGSRTNRIEQAVSLAGDQQMGLKERLSATENTDLAKASVDLKLAEVAYQASLSAVSRAVQPSLIDFLR